MRWITSVLAAGLLVTASVGVALAQSTSPEPSEALVRVEASEAGIALSLPESWAVEVEMLEISRQPLEPGELVVTSILQAWSPTQPVFSGLYMQKIPPFMGLFMALEHWVEAGIAGDGFFLDEVDSHTQSHLDLPEGDAIRVVYEGRDGDVPLAFVQYFIAAEDGVYVLFFRTTPGLAPDDNWLAIAETIEFLPDETEQAWQRVEFPAAGVAFGLPPDWDAEPYDGMDGMDLVSPLGGPATCFLSDLAPFDLESLDAIESRLISRAADGSDGQVVSRVQLPIGEALVVEREEAWDVAGGDLKDFSLDLYIPTPRHHAWLHCGDIATSGGDVEAITLAIAETFEFLSGEE